MQHTELKMKVKVKSPLIGLPIKTPQGVPGEVASVDNEKGTLKIRFENGTYADYTYSRSGG